MHSPHHHPPALLSSVYRFAGFSHSSLPNPQFPIHYSLAASLIAFNWIKCVRALSVFDLPPPHRMPMPNPIRPNPRTANKQQIGHKYVENLPKIAISSFTRRGCKYFPHQLKAAAFDISSSSPIFIFVHFSSPPTICLFSLFPALCSLKKKTTN